MTLIVGNGIEVGIAREVHTLLWDLNTIRMPRLAGTDEPIRSITEALRELPRSGKLVRIHQFELALPVQSHYDHLIAVAKIAEIVAGSRILSSDDKARTAQCVAFHDLPELLTGDHPDWTALELIRGVNGISTGVSTERALIAIRESLPPHLRKQFDRTDSQLEQRNTESYQIFKFADKIEPILAVWRYLECYKTKLNVEHFINAMTDFFENPKVADYCYDEEQRDAARFFQCKDAALRYVAGEIPGSAQHSYSLTSKLLSDVVSHLKMHTVSQVGNS